MQWIHDYQLFLFDFDGLLVNTEEIHYLAYKRMCSMRDLDLSWDFTRYCLAAHYDQAYLRQQIFLALPKLQEMESNWEVLYAEKKQAMLELLREGAIHLMPGAEHLLKILHERKISHCVVTNSPDEQISIVREKNPILNTIPYWFTRETYTHPKPHPECYLNAIKQLGGESKNVIGFEDTPRGLRALMQTKAKPVLISRVNYPEIPEFVNEGVLHFSGLDTIVDLNEE